MTKTKERTSLQNTCSRNDQDPVLDYNHLCESFRKTKKDSKNIQKLKESFSEKEEGRHPWFRHVK